MKHIGPLTAAATVALTGLALATPAVAAPAAGSPTTIKVETSHGFVVDADWEGMTSPTTFAATYLSVSQETQGSELYIEHVAANLDAQGEFTGGRMTRVDVTSGFTFTIDTLKLSSASAQGTDLPAVTCDLSPAGEESGCTDTTVDVQAAWTATGQLGRDVYNEHYARPGFSVNVHGSGLDRTASATGVLDGTVLGTDQLQFASLLKGTNRTIIRFGA